MASVFRKSTLLIRCEVDSEMDPSDYRVMGVGCDVSSELSVQQAFRRVVDTYGRVDSVVASAGIVENYSAFECVDLCAIVSPCGDV